MTPKRKRRGRSESRARNKSEAEHLRLLGELELVDSCCEICHCDCYSSHSGSSAGSRVDQAKESRKELIQLDKDIRALEQLQRRESAKCRRSASSHSQRSASRSPTERKSSQSRRRSADSHSREPTSNRSRRSKSAGNYRSGSQEKESPNQPQEAKPQKPPKCRGAQRDCKMLQVRDPHSEVDFILKRPS